MSLDHLAEVLADADREHAAEVEALEDLEPDQVEYLAAVADRRDAITDGLEGRCV